MSTRPTAVDRDLVLSDEDLAEIAKKADAASPDWTVRDEWEMHDGGFSAACIVDGPHDIAAFYGGGDETDGGRKRQARADLAFAQTAHVALPVLVAEVRRQRTVLRQVRAAIEGRTGSVNVSVILSALGEQE